MNEEAPLSSGDSPEAVATLVAPAGYGDCIFYTEDGPVRFLEGRARVPLSVAMKHLRPGWTIESGAVLEKHPNERNAT